MHDVLYVVRPGETNEELRYSLRSLKNLPHRRVWIAGYKPRWVCNVIHVDLKQTDKPDLANVNVMLRFAASCVALSDDFVFMNDDFFIMQPIDKVPTLHQGDMLSRIESYKNSSWLQAYSMITTRRVLLELGAFHMKSYELHVPMMFNKFQLTEMYGKIDQRLEPFSVRPRSMYGNMFHVEGDFNPDVKNTKNVDQTFLSSDEFSFDTSLIGERVRAAFPEPSPYETAAKDVMDLQDAARQAAHRDQREPSSHL